VITYQLRPLYQSSLVQIAILLRSRRIVDSELLSLMRAAGGFPVDLTFRAELVAGEFSVKKVTKSRDFSKEHFLVLFISKKHFFVFIIRHSIDSIMVCQSSKHSVKFFFVYLISRCRPDCADDAPHRCVR
jgi:hypothetical protein